MLELLNQLDGFEAGPRYIDAVAVYIWQSLKKLGTHPTGYDQHQGHYGHLIAQRCLSIGTARKANILRARS